jgi:PAS domain S-box-containing protein
MTSGDDIRDRFVASLGRSLLGEELFDAISDTVFFVKDAAGRYVAVNRTLLNRLGLRDKAEIIGRTAADVFPAVLGQRFLAQDRRVLKDGAPIHEALELHLYPGGAEGWCLTWKAPLRTARGRIAGLIGQSRDVQNPGREATEAAGLSRALDHVRDHLDEPLRVTDLAARAGLSAYQFDGRVRALFGVSAGQYVTRARIERACALLKLGHDSVGQIAQACGYADQAAFTRQFRKSVGLTPRVYRAGTMGR